LQRIPTFRMSARTRTTTIPSIPSIAIAIPSIAIAIPSIDIAIPSIASTVPLMLLPQ